MSINKIQNEYLKKEVTKKNIEFFMEMIRIYVSDLIKNDYFIITEYHL